MRKPDPRNEATVVLRRQSLVGPVLARVIGMLAARADAPVDRLDDVLLVSDAIAAHGPAHAANGDPLQVQVETTEDELRLLVGPLRKEGASGMLAAAELPGVGNIVEQVASEVTVQTETDGGESLLIILQLGS